MKRDPSPAAICARVGRYRSHGLLKRIDSRRCGEELAAIAYLAAARKRTGLLFETITGDRPARASSPTCRSSKSVCAAVGLDPRAVVPRDDFSNGDILQRADQAVVVAKGERASTRLYCAATRSTSRNFQRRNSGQATAAAISDRRHHADAQPDTGRINVGCYRQMLHGPRRVGLYCSPGKHGLIDREAWWRAASRCEVVAAYGIDRCCSCGGAVFASKESELDVAGGLMGHGVELTEADICEPADPRQRRARDRGSSASRRQRRGRPAREFTGYYGRERAPQPVIE